jgi:two-component system NarL family sensor kinase
LAGVNEHLKDFELAYRWLSKSKVITDSINDSQTKLKINEIESKFRGAEDRQKILALEGQAKQAVLNAQNRNLYMWLFGLGCLLLLLILVSVVLNARNKRKLSVQKEINYRQQLEELERKQQLKVTKAMLDGEERERERVARDLHDGLGGMLAGVKIGFSGWTSTSYWPAGFSC